MFQTPQLPHLAPRGISDFTGSWASLPLQLDISPLVLVVLTSLAGIFIGAVSVVLIYHWRRFPFEQEIFRNAERIYIIGVGVFLALAFVGILLT